MGECMQAVSWGHVLTLQLPKIGLGTLWEKAAWQGSNSGQELLQCQQTGSPWGLAVLFANRDKPVASHNTAVGQRKPRIFSSHFIYLDYPRKSEKILFVMVGKLKNPK